MLLKHTPPARDGAVGASKKTPLFDFHQWDQGSCCNVHADWINRLQGTSRDARLATRPGRFLRPIWAVVCRRRGLSQGYSSATGLALQRSTSLPVITFLSWLILLGSWGSPGVWNVKYSKMLQCCWGIFFAPHPLLQDACRCKIVCVVSMFL